MLSWSNRLSSPVILLALAPTLAGCVTGTEVSYSEFQNDRYGGTERIYEHDLYSDPANGIQSERCRTVVERRTNAWGEERLTRARDCSPTGLASGGEPWTHSPPQEVYPDPVDPALPPADVPDEEGAELAPE
jgi:hypothetical protein